MRRVWDDFRPPTASAPTTAAEFALNLIILDNALWTFVANAAVEPTNNAVERALRQIVIHRKTSYGTQTEHGSSVYETLQSVVRRSADDVHQEGPRSGMATGFVACRAHGGVVPTG